ncbi:MAG: family 16 glycosylhydrolase [Bacteroidales bacterium]|nr:family 16 glycosylhydrolase [Bacteroidales bacterium]
MKKTLLILATALLTCCGSGGKEDTTPDTPAPEITLSTQSVTLSEEGETVSITVKVNTSFAISVDQGADWLTVSAGSVFKGESVLNVTAKENTSGASRRATVLFSCNTPGSDKKASIQVSQAALVPQISFSPSSVSFPEEGGTVEVEMTANTTWEIKTDGAYWYSVNRTSAAKGTATLKITAINNFSDKERNGSITFTSAGNTAELAVKQDPGTPIEDGAYVPEGYTLVWHDEFEGKDIDTDLWKFENWPARYVNNELQRYVPNDARTAFLTEGILNIRAMKADGGVISARMNTTGSWKYGYFEARLKLPKGKGTWPAYWMMPNDQSLGWPACGEIDIMEEVGVEPNITSSSIHTKAYNHVKNTQKTANRYIPGAEDEFHIYSLEWTEDEIRTYVDGELLLTFRNDKTGNNDTWPFNKTFYITLNLAWGGDWGGYAGVDENALPTIFQIDYVRVYQK